MSKKIEVCNNAVFVIRDEAETQKNGLLLPDSSVEKPSTGIIYGVGSLVEDKKIKSGKKAMFHKGIGFSLEHEGQEYLVLQGNEIIAVLDASDKQ